jgi:hypothetical protein
MNPWPWRRLRDFPVRERLARFAKKFGVVLTILGLLLSPIGLLAHAAAYWRWRVMNDNWYSRPGLLALTGFIGTLTIQSAWTDGLAGFYRWVLTSLGTPSEIPAALISWILIGAFPAMLVTSVQSAGFTLVYEFDQKAWTRPMRPNLFKQFRAYRHTRTLKSGAEPVKGHIVFGLHVDDTLPWGNGRHGAYVTKASEKIGHGFILGQAGSGKTAEALNLADQFIHAGMSMVVPDFKGDNLTRRSLKASAESAGSPFYSFSFSPMGDEPNVHYDPLNWEGSSNDKAALIMKALPFPAEDSAAAYYRTKAEAYLPLQFDVLNRVGLAKGEGTFDFLLATVEPLRLIERLEPLRGGDAVAKEEFSRWHALISSHSAKDLEGLRGNLGKVVNAGGKYLRPATEDGAVTLDLRKVLDEGAVVYFDLPQTLDSVSSITMGTLLMQDVKAMIGQRSKDSGHDWRDVILMSDEASSLGLRADVMDDISKQGRSAKIWNWVVTQSIITWPETTMREVLNNATVRIVFVMQEGESQKLLTEGMPESYYIDVRKGIDLGDANMMETSHRAGRAGTEQALTEKQLTPSDIGKIPNRKAWIWFSGTNEGVNPVHGFARKRWLPVKDEAPSEVVVISPVLRQRVADVISDHGRTSNAAIAAAPESSESPAAHVDATWTLERLPSPDASFLSAPTSESRATVPARHEVAAGMDDEDDFEDFDEGPAGSEPLHVTLSRMNRKAPPASAAAPAGSVLLEEPRTAVAAPAPEVRAAPAAATEPEPAPEAPKVASAAEPAPGAKVNPLMVQANPLLAKPAPPAAPKREEPTLPERAPEPEVEDGQASTPDPLPEVTPAASEPMSAPATFAAITPQAANGFVNKNPFV